MLEPNHIVGRVSASSARDNQWVVTCADDGVYEELLVPFLASLFSVAKWTGRVAVFDYGLSPQRAARLRDLGIEVEPVRRITFVNLDRFLHLRKFCRKHSGLISHWDADMWFCTGISELFDHYQHKHGQRAVCCIDPVFQTTCYDVAFDSRGRRKVKRILDWVSRKYGNVLQCAFMCGPSEVIGDFCDTAAALLVDRELKPVWNSDTVALNYFCYRNPERVEVIPPHYNCVPDWRPQLRHHHPYLEGQKVRVLHITSPYRYERSATAITFPAIHPQHYRRWLAQLS